MAISGKVTVTLRGEYTPLGKADDTTVTLENVEAVWSNRQFLYVRTSENPGLEDSKGPFRLIMYPSDTVALVIVDIFEATDKDGWYSSFIGPDGS